MATLCPLLPVAALLPRASHSSTFKRRNGDTAFRQWIARQGFTSRSRPTAYRRTEVQAVIGLSDNGLSERAEKILNRLGFCVKEGVFGFTPFAELFCGRMAIFGCAAALITHLHSGRTILEQMGLEPNNATHFEMLLNVAMGAIAVGTLDTLKRAVRGEMTRQELERYRQVLSLSDDENSGDEEMKFLVKAPSEVDCPVADARSRFTLVDEVDKNVLSLLEVETGRVAMLGFLAAILLDAYPGNPLY
eukprot:jgi/Mesvir1/9712/Mv12184-RA.1